MKLTTNFQLTEFNCNDGTEVPERLLDNVKELAKNLQVIRDEVGPLHVLSGYRTPAWNKKVGGKPNSYHMKAMAADLVSPTLKPRELKSKIEKLIKDKKITNGGIGLYPSFVHYDIGPTRRW